MLNPTTPDTTPDFLPAPYGETKTFGLGITLTKTRNGLWIETPTAKVFMVRAQFAEVIEFLQEGR